MTDDFLLWQSSDNRIWSKSGKVGSAVPVGVTQDPMKRALYGIDPYFVQAWEDFSAAFPRVREKERVIDSHSLLLLKPDVVARGLEGRIHSWLATNSFIPVFRSIVSINRHRAIALWTYQWNYASGERRHLTELMMTLTECVVLVVRSRDDSEQAARRLGNKKGSAQPANLQPGELRNALSPINFLVNGVHAPADAADFIREFSILIEPSDQLAALSAMRNRQQALVPFSDSAFTSRTTEVDVALERATWVQSQFQGVGQPRGAAGSRSIEGWLELLKGYAKRESLHLNSWDYLLHLCASISPNRTELTRLID